MWQPIKTRAIGSGHRYFIFVIADDDQTMGVARAVDVNQSLSATPVPPARMHPWDRAVPDRDAQKLRANALSHSHWPCPFVPD